MVGTKVMRDLPAPSLPPPALLPVQPEAGTDAKVDMSADRWHWAAPKTWTAKAPLALTLTRALLLRPGGEVHTGALGGPATATKGSKGEESGDRAPGALALPRALGQAPEM